MKIGDIVRLRQPFRPEPDRLEEYCYGIVIGLVEVDRLGCSVDDWGEEGARSRFSEVILQLYNPDTSTIYTDEFDTQPMFHFRINELELSNDIQDEQGDE